MRGPIPLWVQERPFECSNYAVNGQDISTWTCNLEIHWLELLRSLLVCYPPRVYHHWQRQAKGSWKQMTSVEGKNWEERRWRVTYKKCMLLYLHQQRGQLPLMMGSPILGSWELGWKRWRCMRCISLVVHEGCLQGPRGVMWSASGCANLVLKLILIADPNTDVILSGCWLFGMSHWLKSLPSVSMKALSGQKYLVFWREPTTYMQQLHHTQMASWWQWKVHRHVYTPQEKTPHSHLRIYQWPQRSVLRPHRSRSLI